MPKTKEQIAIYNKAYFARPNVRARAKIRNAKRREKRREYKKSLKGKEAEKRYRSKESVRSRIADRNRYRLLIRYGITIDTYESILLEQDGVCAICLMKKEETLHVDHCHNTGKVRGLLCGSCNRALGLMKDNTDFLLKAIQYLQK